MSSIIHEINSHDHNIDATNYSQWRPLGGLGLLETTKIMLSSSGNDEGQIIPWPNDSTMSGGVGAAIAVTALSSNMKWCESRLVWLICNNVGMCEKGCHETQSIMSRRTTKVGIPTFVDLD